MTCGVLISQEGRVTEITSWLQARQEPIQERQLMSLPITYVQHYAITFSNRIRTCSNSSYVIGEYFEGSNNLKWQFLTASRRFQEMVFGHVLSLQLFTFLQFFFANQLIAILLCLFNLLLPILKCICVYWGYYYQMSR